MLKIIPNRFLIFLFVIGTFLSCKNVVKEQYSPLDKNYNLDSVIEYLKPSNVSAFLIDQVKDSISHKYIGVSLDDCQNVGINGVDPTVALSYTALMIFEQGLGTTEGVRVELTYGYEFKRTGPITNEKIGNAKTTYSKAKLEWAKEAYLSFKNWYEGKGENNFNTCIVQDSTIITDNIELLKEIKLKYSKIKLNGFAEVTTNQQGFKEKLLLIFKAYDEQGQAIALFATARLDNVIESVFISTEQDKGFDTAGTALKNHCFLY